MTVRVISTIKPNGLPLGQTQFPTVEDIDILGGFQVQPSTSARDAIPTLNRKAGMLVYVTSNGTFYQLAANLTTWNVLSLGGSVTLNGDVTGPAGGNLVVNIQGNPVSNAAPGIGQILGWTGSQWAPTNTSLNTLAIDGNAIKSQALGSAQDGYILTWINADSKWEALPLLVGSVPAKIVNLGVSSAFGVLAGSTVTNTGGSSVNGDVGVSAGTSIVGFPPGTLTGSLHPGDSAAAAAQLALTDAFNAGNALLGGVTVGADIGGQTLFTGIYKNASSLAITGTLVLDAQGNPNASWVFQIGSTLTTAAGNSTVSLINGALPANVFWLVGSSATLGTNTTFAGNILAQASITATTGAAISGRLLARVGAVTLDTNAITIPPQPSSGLPPSGPAGGDLSGFFPNPLVVGLQGKPLSSSLSSIGASQDGYVLTWDNIDGYWLAKQTNALSTNIAQPNTSYAAPTSNQIILVGTLSTPINITLPASPTTGQQLVIKDANGSATTFNITVVHNGHNIDGTAGNFILSTNYQSVQLIYSGTRWNLL